MGQYLLSLCIPTNGVSEWIFPVLDSIYSQNVSMDLFEVVVTDNGVNIDFQKKMEEYAIYKSNLLYFKTKADGFLNQIESFRHANGIYLKFINHRMILKNGSLQYLLNFVRDNRDEKPVAFFLNSSGKETNKNIECKTFDRFVYHLSFWSSWSGGLGCWKEDFLNVSDNIEYNSLFPHTTILFNERDKSKYFIDNTHLMEELPVGNIPKGKYNLFYAFAVEYPSIILNLLKDGDICIDTFYHVKKDNLFFLESLYWDYILLRKKCSYDLADYKRSLDVFYSYKFLEIDIFSYPFKKVISKILKGKYDAQE